MDITGVDGADDVHDDSLCGEDLELCVGDALGVVGQAADMAVQVFTSVSRAYAESRKVLRNSSSSVSDGRESMYCCSKVVSLES